MPTVLPHSLGIVRSGGSEPVAWKNGQGATREIARRLLGVRGPHFVWRISVSDITADADLGEFPGVRRSMTLIAGDGLLLEAGSDKRELAPFEPYAFDAALEAHARLTSGPVSVLNVLSVRSRGEASVRVVDLSGGRPTSIAGATALVLLTGEATVSGADGSSDSLAALDALTPKNRVRVVSGTGRAAVIRLENFRGSRSLTW